MLDKLEDMKWFIQDHIKEIGAGIVIIIAIVVGTVFATNGKGDKKDGTKENTKAEYTQMEKKAESLREVFSELQTVEQGINRDNIVLKTSLYLKQPFITDEELRTQLGEYVEILKKKYNVDKKYVTGLDISIYDRKIVFDKELQPRATAYYMLNAKKDDKVKEDESQTPQEGQKDMFGNPIKKTTPQTQNKTEKDKAVWEDTISQKGKPKYEDYEWVVNDFEPLNKDIPVKPLSDEEFAFYLKLNQYSTLMGSPTGGAQLYLQWDLGQNVFKDGVGAILKEFKAFTERQTKLGGLADYYDNVDKLKKKLAIERPQFLLFAETQEVVDDKSEAQAKLIKFNANLYTDAIKENIDKVAEEVKEEKPTKQGKQEKQGKPSDGNKGEKMEIDFTNTEKKQ